MKRIFTLLFFSALICTMAVGQAPSAVIKKATTAPVIDGTIDDVWSTADPNLIDKPFTGETPTLGASGDTWWKALWDDKGIYVLINVTDDVWAPAFASSTPTTNTYLYDKVEIYFDTNYNLKDGKGPLTDGTGGGNGHYQLAPDPVKDSISGQPSSKSAHGARYAFNVTDPNYIAEFFMPFSKLLDSDGVMVDKAGTIGFDITISDNDVPSPGTGVRNRAVWANTNASGKGESWNNMDDCGTITLEGAEPTIDITALTITGGTTITTDNGTLQFTAAVTPTDATQGYKWILTNGTGMATISKDGLVTALRDGTVTVKASSSDDFVSSNEITITISNQKVTHFESSYIKDGDFTMGTGTTPSSFWSGTAMVENGVMTISNPSVATAPNPWDWTISQTINIPEEMKNTPFVLQFKAWADEARPFDVDIENIGGNYIRFGDSPDANALEGHSQWHFELTTVPTVYKQTITNFNRMDAANPQQQFHWFAGMATPKVYVDSVFLVTQDDYILKAKSLANSINRVYPNPVGNDNTLFIELSASKTNVAIYNAIGQKLMEKAVTGNLVNFDVSSLQRGMYFVKLSDGSIQKFIK